VTKKNSILIVDDNPSNLMELSYMLEDEYDILTAMSGTSALEKAETFEPDLILLDMIMADKNGFEVLGELKSSEKSKSIPVIFMTGPSEESKERAGLAIGAVDFIRKPFDEAIVKLRVRQQIEIINLKRDLENAVNEAADELRQKLINSFIMNNQDKFNEIMEALNAGAVKLAHRLTHTLKSNAEQLGKTFLHKAAEEVEFFLKDGENRTSPEQLIVLERELNVVIEELTPLVTAREIIDPVKASDGLAEAGTGKKNTVLIVDDDTSNLLALTYMLSEYKVFAVKDGAAALEKVAESIPDLILLDIILPDMSGFEILAELKKSNKTKSVPVIFLTGLSGDDNKREGLAMGAADYIHKPFSETTVKFKVREQIKRINHSI